jgi:PAS domain S-box-containing protein
MVRELNYYAEKLNSKKYKLKIMEKLTIGIIIMLILYHVNIKDYFIFHNLVELLSIITGFSVFIIAKNTYGVSKNSNFMFLGMCFLIISSFDFLHVLTSYNGGVFNTEKYNVSIQFYLVGRYIQTAVFILFCILSTKKEKISNASNVIIFFYASALIFFFLIFKFHYFPVCYDPKIGLTLFKRISEYIMFVIFFIITVILFNNKNKTYESISKFLILSTAFMAASELCFAVYINYTSIISILGHIFKLISFYFIYKFIVNITLQKPYDMIFYELRKAYGDLENRTKELEDINKKLNQSKKNYQALLDFLPYAMFAQCDGKFVFVNNAALNLLKYENYSDILGKEVMNYVHEDYHKIIIDRMNKVYKEGITTDLIEIKLIAKDGEIIDVETKSSPYVLKDKKGVLVVAGDIRERKDAQKKGKALEEAKECDRVKNEFMANISHELRTPLNVIFGALQLIEYYIINDNIYENKQNIKKYIKSMKQNSYRMLKLVNNLIDLSKIDSGFLKLNLQNYNIVSVVEDITFSVVQYIESKGINIEFDTEVEEKYMACDVYVIERIILNLLSNAIKFTNKGGKIWVNIYDKGDWIVIKVKDSGIGIPEDKIEVVFDRFKQVDTSFTKNIIGSGIGLNLVKSLIELHGGSISLKSKVNVGSEFTIKLPVKLTSENEIAVTIDNAQEKVERIHIEFSDIYY